jgi:hypothetical protein
VNAEGGTTLRAFYRIVLTDPPTPVDFTSFAALGRRPRRADSNVDRLWDGLSMYDTEERARQKARQLPYLGGYLARVMISIGAPFRVERTLASPGHHTVWGDPTALLNCVTGVVPV